MEKKVCAGIVSYNPNLSRLQQNVSSIIQQVERIYLVDNGSVCVGEIEKIFRIESKIVIIKNDENLGIAKALNQICSRANDDGFSWVLTLDQDTVSPSNLIQELIPFANEDDVGIVCPAVFYEGRDKIVEIDKSSTPVKACMTSGSLTNVRIWTLVGGFREDYFVDFVDNEFCLKIKIHGCKIIRVNSCVISHQLGDAKRKQILGVFNVRFTAHSPLRFYYMIRNNRVFIREYKKYINMPKEFCKLWYILLRGIFFSENKKDTFRYVVKGYWHALKGVMGPFRNV